MLALLWLVFVLSFGATSLLMLLLRRGAATMVSSLMYLVPPVTAIIAYLLFDERLSVTAIAGTGKPTRGVDGDGVVTCASAAPAWLSAVTLHGIGHTMACAQPRVAEAVLEILRDACTGM